MSSPHEPWRKPLREPSGKSIKSKGMIISKIIRGRLARPPMVQTQDHMKRVIRTSSPTNQNSRGTVVRSLRVTLVLTEATKRMKRKDHLKVVLHVVGIIMPINAPTSLIPTNSNNSHYPLSRLFINKGFMQRWTTITSNINWALRNFG